jgi:uncharacterized OB-fold protein
MSDLESLLPAVDDTNRPYWQGLAEGRLRMLRCERCGKVRYQPSRFCAACGGDKAEWVQLSGRGRIWARCAFHQVYFAAFRERVPYGVVIVELDEGPRVYSNLADGVDAMTVPIGTRVDAVFEKLSDERTLLKFRPAPEEGMTS